MCGTTLDRPEGSIAGSSASDSTPTAPAHRIVLSKSAPASRPDSPAPDESIGAVDNTGDKDRYIRLSFRQGGDKAFYAALKTALQSKSWEVRRAGACLIVH